MVGVWTRIIVRTFLIIVAIILSAWILYELGTVLLLIIFSIFFCYLIAPLVRLIEQPLYIAGREFKAPRGVAILFVYAAVGFMLFLFTQLVSPLMTQEVDTLKEQWPRYKDA